MAFQTWIGFLQGARSQGAISTPAATAFNPIAEVDAGVPFDSGVALCIDSSAAFAWDGGLPKTVDGRLAAGVNPVAGYQDGLPIDAAGRLVVGSL